MSHSKQWHYSLHRDFQNYNSTRRSPTGFFSSNSTRVPIHHTTIHHPQATYREFSIQNPILHAEDKELFECYYYIQRAERPSLQKRNSTHRRQGDLLEIHLCVIQDFPKTFEAFQQKDLPKAFQTFQSLQTFQTFQSFMTIQPIQAILQVPVSPGNPPHSSTLQLECIFYKFYSSIGFHKKLQRVPVEQCKLQTLHSSKKGRCCDIGQNMQNVHWSRCQDDIFSRIELSLQTSCHQELLITRMTFNSFLSCLISKVSIEITINTSKWHECTKQWNGNSHISSHKWQVLTSL